MDSYFESLKNSVQDPDQANNNKPVESSEMATLTVKVDVDCKLFCDGDFLDLFEANKVKKIPIEVGQHLITIESEHYEGVSEDQVVDASEAGKNYLLLVNDMKQKEKALLQEQEIEIVKKRQEEKKIEEARKAEEQKKKQEEEVRQKEEERLKREEQKKLEEQQRLEDLQRRQEIIKDAYVVLTDLNKTLTFYYDDKKDSRGGVDIGEGLHLGWSGKQREIKTVNFDISFADYTGTRSTKGWFSGCCNLVRIYNLANLNTRNVTSMKGMFAYCKILEKLDLSNFDTRNVTTMKDMFYDCNNLSAINLTHFNTENVEDMTGMFRGCKSLTELNLSSFNTRRVKSMGSMFALCNNIIRLNLSNFCTENVEDMSFMFSCCYNLESLDLSSFNMQSIKEINDIFYQCAKLDRHKYNQYCFDGKYSFNQ